MNNKQPMMDRINRIKKRKDDSTAVSVILLFVLFWIVATFIDIVELF